MDDLFRLAEKYMANGVLVKLKQILVSSSPSPDSLRDDPIGVYAIACGANLDAEMEVAIPHTFKMDSVLDVSQAHIDMMTVVQYNHLLIAHAARRADLISAVNKTKGPPFEECACGHWLYTGLRQDITLAILEKSILHREKLYSCTKTDRESKCGRGSGCRVSYEAISGYFTSVLVEIWRCG